MNKMRARYEKFVIVVGVFTFVAMTVLFVELLGWLKGGAIALSFSSYIGILIWLFLRRSKAIEFNPAQDQTLTIRELRIPLRTSLERLKLNWTKISLAHLFIILLFNLNVYWMFNEIHQKILILCTLFYVFLAFTISFIKSSPLRAALKLVGRKERVFSLEENGLSIPIELLNESAMHKAIKKKESDIFVPWSEIQEIETFNNVGQSLPQFTVKLSEQNPYSDFMGLMAIMRTQEIDQELERVQTIFYLRKKLKQATAKN